MKKISNLALIYSKNARSLAYLNILQSNNLLPNTIISLDVKKKYKSLKTEKNKFFKNNINIEKFCSKNKIKLIKTKNLKINDEKYLNIVKKIHEKYIIYAVNYGDILSKKYFLLNKKFIHIHPGKLPKFKGSTTFYYQILKENCISYSAIFQNRKIDDGKIILSKTYSVKKDNIIKSKLDQVYDPYLRSLVLLKVIQKLKKLKKLQSKNQSKKNKKIYYIIHPILKHISILSKN